jgi:hypothetical protein
LETIKVSLADNFAIQMFYNHYCAWVYSQRIRGIDEPLLLEHSFEHYQCIDANEIDRIKDNTDDILFLDIIKEGPHQFHLLQTFPDNKHYVILSGADWDEQHAPLNIEYTKLYYSVMLFDLSHYAQNNQHCYSFLNSDYNFDYPKKLLFVHTANSAKSHRDYAVKKLLPVLKTDYVFKYQGQDYGADSSEWDVVGDDIVPDFEHLYTGEELATFGHCRHFVNQLYDQAYFNFITESDWIDTFWKNNQPYHQHQFFITEKTTKCLMYGMPFVVAGTANFLSRLHDMGFQTYSDLWDESYDQELHPARRLSKVFQTVKSLQHFDWHSNRSKLIEIAQHNKHVYNNINVEADRQFTVIQGQLKKLINERRG